MTNKNNNVTPIQGNEVSIQLSEEDLKAEQAAKKAVGLDKMTDQEFRKWVSMNQPYLEVLQKT